MPGTGLEASPHNIQLPATGPRIKLTTDLGSAHQQVRNFFQPVTVVGSSPQAQVHIESDVVSDFHCALVNTGWCILLKDLHTPTGLLRNREVIRMGVLNDGDILRVGPSPLHLAIRVPMGVVPPKPAPDDSSPLLMPQVIRVQGPALGETVIESSVAVIGSRLGCEVYLSHAEVKPIHALVVAVGDEIAIYNLAQETQTQVNDRLIPFGGIEALQSADMVRIGPFELRVHLGGHTRPSNESASTELAENANNSLPETAGCADELSSSPNPVGHYVHDPRSINAQDRIRKLLDSVKVLRDGLK